MQDSGKADPILEDVYSFLCTLLYIRYDMSMPFEDQFEANALVLEEFIEKAKLSFPQTEEGQNK